MRFDVKVSAAKGWAVAVHAGAGPLREDDDPQGAAAGCRAAVDVAKALLTQGHSCLDAVEAAVRCLEDNPRFNAGTGSALNSDGEVEMDAAIMRGLDRGFGAVAGLRTFLNPVQVARAVMERTPHTFLMGQGAERFALQAGFAPVDPSALITDKARARLASWGTVGAVAIDRLGHLAAATSTGGMTGKLPGRVGDSPLPGAGTWASDGEGAVSCTGHGEFIMRSLLAKSACVALAKSQDPLSPLFPFESDAGLILITPDGSLCVCCNTPRMPFAWAMADGRLGDSVSLT